MAPGREIAGYRVLAHVGSGAASELYAVQDPKTKQVWALKHVEKTTDKDQRFLDQVTQEHTVGCKLEHPTLRGVEKIIKHRKKFKTVAVSLIMELVDGVSLDQRLPKNDLAAVKIFIEVAQGLAHMHDRGYVHADMKPSNVLITDRDHVKIIDLGQAAPVGTEKTRIQGTPGYMAPEQAHREAITPGTDIYNFGAMMYWVLVKEVIPTALPPKEGSGSLYSGALDADMVDAPVPPHEKNPRIDERLSKLVLDCVELRPDDRPDSMDAVVSRLKLIAEILEAPASEPPPLVGDEDTVF